MTRSGHCRRALRRVAVSAEPSSPEEASAPLAPIVMWAGRFDPEAPGMAFYDGSGNPLGDAVPPLQAMVDRYTSRTFVTRDGVAPLPGRVMVSLIVCAWNARARVDPGCMRALRLLIRHGHRVAVFAPSIADAEAVGRGLLSMVRAAG